VEQAGGDGGCEDAESSGAAELARRRLADHGLSDLRRVTHGASRRVAVAPPDTGSSRPGAVEGRADSAGGRHLRGILNYSNDSSSSRAGGRASSAVDGGRSVGWG
jgi:hypothetical protein